MSWNSFLILYAQVEVYYGLVEGWCWVSPVPPGILLSEQSNLDTTTIGFFGSCSTSLAKTS